MDERTGTTGGAGQPPFHGPPPAAFAALALLGTASVMT